MTGSSPAEPERRSLNPGVLAIRNSRSSPGLRRSASTSSTRLPCCASTTARFAAVMVFPSPGSGLETSSDFRSAEASKTDVPSARQASAAAVRGSVRHIICGTSPTLGVSNRGEGWCCGMIASEGIAVNDSTSAGSRRARSIPSLIPIAAALSRNPRNRPM